MEKLIVNSLKKGENIYLIPPYLKDKEKQILDVWQSQEFQEHVYLFSSGTTSKSLTSYVLSFKSLFNNAKSVNEFLDANSKDVWLSTLPIYHVGGLSIYIRAYLAGSKVILANNEKWSAKNCLRELEQNNINFCSFVPEQCFYIAQSNFKAPESLKGVFVGGDYLSPNITRSLIKLGWPLIITYGMTETCSQIASSYYHEIKNGFIKVLPIHSIENEHIYSRSLYSAKIIFKDNKSEVEIFDQDSFELKDDFKLKEVAGEQYLKPLGRKDDYIKINGRLYHLVDLKDLFSDIFYKLAIIRNAEVQLLAASSGEKKILILLDKVALLKREKIEKLVEQEVPFLHKLVSYRTFEDLPRTALGKLKKIY